MQLVLLIASGLVTAYSFILILRVLVSWFSGEQWGAPWRFLYLITEPVLKIFRGLRILRTGTVDFTPLAAIISLQIIASLLGSFAYARFFSLLMVAAARLLAVWRIVFSILVFFAIVAVIRLGGLLWSRRPGGAFFQVLDGLLGPLVLLVSRLFPRRHESDYRVVLGVLSGILVVLSLIGFIFVEPTLLQFCLSAGLRML
jgi:YggT family protein